MHFHSSKAWLMERLPPNMKARTECRTGALTDNLSRRRVSSAVGTDIGPPACFLPLHVMLRIWRQMKQYAPFLSALDFLPRFTFTITIALAVVAFLVAAHPLLFGLPTSKLLTCCVYVQVKCMCFDDDDWLEGSPQPTSETVLRQRREREMRKQQAAKQAQGKVGEVEAELVKKATAKTEMPNPAAEKKTAEKKKD